MRGGIFKPQAMLVRTLTGAQSFVPMICFASVSGHLICRTNDIRKWVSITDIDWKFPTPLTLCVMRGQPWSSSWRFSVFWQTHGRRKWKQNKPTIFAQCFTPVYLHAQNAVRTHLTNHTILQKKTNTPNWSPWRDKDGKGSGICGLYLWFQCKLQNIK